MLYAKLAKSKARTRQRGITLILVAGVLTILAAMATGFYSITLSQTKSATRYVDSVRAELCAHAGIESAVSQLREQAFKETEGPSSPWFRVDYTQNLRNRVSFPIDFSKNGLDDDRDGVVDGTSEREMPFSGTLGSSVEINSDRYILNINDAASRININAGENLGMLLDNLCRVVGPPLVAADIDMLQPGRWAAEGANAGMYGTNPDDQIGKMGSDEFRDCYYHLYDEKNNRTKDGTGRPRVRADGTAIYGDGFAIAAYRARHGRFVNLEDVKNALTFVKQSTSNKERDEYLEGLEREAKFQALREFITIDSWVDTTTVCTGKFEWIDDSTSGRTLCIDRDKSWIPSVDAAGKDIVDPINVRGSLAGCYLSIVSGHGAGQLRRILRNGIDWVEVEHGLVVKPGPISAYMIIAKEDAKLEDVPGVTPTTQLPQMNADGTLIDDPNIDYALRPLCIHRAPVNINTASDKVLAALFMGINTQHGHPMAVGTDAVAKELAPTWKQNDPNDQEPYLLSLEGLKRIPIHSGKVVFDKPMPPAAGPEFAYLNNNGMLDPKGSANINEAQELTYRIIQARQDKDASGKALGNDPLTNYKRGPFKSWDDLFFRVVKPWDDEREYSVASLIMAHFNSNTNLLKFNPNIEWIDRWGRNFTEMEPVLVYDGAGPAFLAGNANAMWSGYTYDNGRPKGAYYARTYRYKSDEMIDKSDLNRSTTEFCFDSGGIYSIQSIGLVTKRGEVLAERKIEALVKVYDVWRESTQRQFVQGNIFTGPAAPASVRGTANAGSVTRHAGVKSPDELSPLVTLPEPLVPMDYKIAHPLGDAGLKDFVSAQHHNAWGQPKAVGQPDSVANKIPPAQWDGQIALATNTAAWNVPDETATFLASFNGDLDTETSMISGREQAKTPKDKRIRVLDTISLLGLLNDGAGATPEAAIDFDPYSYDVFATSAANNPKLLGPLNKDNYWENVMCRMGDLRTEGVFLGNVGTAGKDATLKYAAVEKGGGNRDRNYDPFNERYGKDLPIEKNNGKTVRGHTIIMWFKPSWHGDDHIEHEFFNATGKGNLFSARYNNLAKCGRYSWACPEASIDGRGGSGGPEHISDNCLAYIIENKADADWKTYMHGGTNRVKPYPTRESPSFHIQPFRWDVVGARSSPHITFDANPERQGWWHPSAGVTSRDEMISHAARAFIASAREPEGPTFKPTYYWKQSNAGTLGGTSGQGEDKLQAAAWRSKPIASDAETSADNVHVFGANNLNQDLNNWLYRGTPLDGTLAVVDEYKLAAAAWSTTKIHEEMTRSRYYTPPHPENPAECPLFVSQSLLQSRQGFDKNVSDEYITPARVSWTVFTPRFLWEAKVPNATRREKVKGSTASTKFRGPFDYIQYNNDVLPADGEAALNPPIPALACARPSPQDYGEQPHATRGVEVELIDSDYADPSASPLGGVTYTDPDAINKVGDVTAPIKVKSNHLHYRVRFRYPFDKLVGAAAGIVPAAVKPSDYYLLDTPVFDDISITYFTRPRFLSYRHVSE